MKKRPKLPPWIRVRVGTGNGRTETAQILSDLKLNTVCGSAECPNLSECWLKRTATFMILGNECTRNCRFCAVQHSSKPLPPENDEPDRIAIAVKKMNLKYVVITSVTRDDLPDGGATHFSKTISAIRNSMPDIKIEVLTPDYLDENLQIVLNANPAVFNHNVETPERLSKEIRIKANYRRSLQTLAEAAKFSNGSIKIKSGLMVGMGETDDEVETAIKDIRQAGATMLTIGQYLPPSGNHWSLERFVHPDTFEQWRLFALNEGFDKVASAPLVRSSYHAEELNENP
jgi:lipoic acid synthetase